MITQTTIDNLLTGNAAAEYPLTLSKEELDIIKNATTSTLILGRSGTGKTTCLVYKMLGRYIFASRFGTGRQKRQVRGVVSFFFNGAFVLTSSRFCSHAPVCWRINWRSTPSA